MTVEQAARDFFGWFNRHYPAPSTNPDHEWNRLGVALTNHQKEAQAAPVVNQQLTTESVDDVWFEDNNGASRKTPKDCQRFGANGVPAAVWVNGRRYTPYQPPRKLTNEEIKALQAEVEQLRADLLESDEIREKLGHLLKRIAAALKGEPPEGVWHSWHDLPERTAQLVDALRKLKERVQRDEALLRQALEALDSDHPDIQLRTAIALRERLADTKVAEIQARCNPSPVR